MADKSLGKDLISVIKNALAAKQSGRIVRSKLDIAELRLRLHLTQQQFDKRYHINLETLRNWEQHKRYPDTTSLAYLSCIAKRPKMIQTLLKPDDKDQ